MNNYFTLSTVLLNKIPISFFIPRTNFIMQFTTVAFAAFALFSSSAHATYCNRAAGQQAPTYSVQVDNVAADVVPGVCGGLWDNLKQFADCIGVSSPACEPRDGGLHWTFANGVSCNTGMVEATWWDATKNKYGSIDCVDT